MAFRHLIWDFNGTLLDDAQLCVDIVAAMLQERGLPELNISRYREVFDFPIRSYYANLGFDFEAESFERLSVRFIDQYERGVGACPLQPGALDLLERCLASGMTSSVLSAANQAFLDGFVANRGLGRLLTDVVGLDHYEADSKIRAGLEWLARAQLDRSSTLLIGDTLHDHEVARALGVPCVLVSCGHQSGRKLSGAGCPVYESLAELTSVVFPDGGDG